MTTTQTQTLSIDLPDGTVSTLTVDAITPDRAVVRSTVEGQPDETVTFERRCRGVGPRGEPFGRVTWRWPDSGPSNSRLVLADWRVREWLDSLAPAVA